MRRNYIRREVRFKVIALAAFLTMAYGIWATPLKAADVEAVLDTTGGGSGFVVKDSVNAEQARINSAGVTTSKNFVSNIASGTQPYATTSTTLNTNLNADMTDGVNVASLTGTRLLRYNSTGTQIENAAVTESSGALAGITTISMSGQLTNTLTTGTSPFSVTSTTVNTNFNADLLDGYSASAIPGTLVGRTVYTATGNYTSSAGVTKAFIEIVGGGGGGGGTNNVAGGAGGGGGSGAYSCKLFTVTPSTAYAFTIGAAGTGTSGAAGGAGGATTITIVTAMTAPGGAGGAYLAGSTAIKFTAGGAGGVPGTGGDTMRAGMPGGFGSTSTVITVQASGSVGTSQFGGGGAGRPTNSAGAGNAGTGYGAGGGGSTSTTTTAYAGGVGTDGAVVVWEFR